MVILENIDIDKAILQNIDIDKISNRFKFGISNRASFTSGIHTTWKTNIPIYINLESDSLVEAHFRNIQNISPIFPSMHIC